MIIEREEFIKWLRQWATQFSIIDNDYGKASTICVTLDVPEILELPYGK